VVTELGGCWGGGRLRREAGGVWCLRNSLPRNYWSLGEGHLSVDHSHHILLISGKELRREVPEDVVDERLRHGDIRIGRESRRLEARVAELVDQVLERDPVLERDAHRDGECLHHAGDRGPFLGNPQEDLARLTVLV